MAEKDEIKTLAREELQKETKRPWLKLALLFPGLLTAIIGAVPAYVTLIRSIQLNVPIVKTFSAEEQNRLFLKNFECMRTRTATTITNKYNVDIQSLVCESGDVLVISKRPEWDQPQRRWVELDTVAPSTNLKQVETKLLTLFSEVYATETDRILLAQASPESVICQRWISTGRLLQRIKKSTGCFDQIIDTYTGRVTSYKPAPCSPDC
ncbi:MAG TPA: hypothetical protein VMT12_11120 [Syntrophales bacterium]|nr:hypothetical protein [Syntrophales bacterium]